MSDCIFFSKISKSFESKEEKAVRIKAAKAAEYEGFTVCCRLRTWALKTLDSMRFRYNQRKSA
jgi:hypothetical protein